jgi:hypothetical protein
MANVNSWKASAESRRKTAEARFWETVESIHKDKLDFSKFVYNGAIEPCTVTCPEHGDFITKPTYLVSGAGCPTCGRLKTITAASGRKLGMDGFVSKAREVHGDTYEYPIDQEYQGNKQKLNIVCRKHGPFSQNANKHLSGRGCPDCSNDLKRERNAVVSEITKQGLTARLSSINPHWEYDVSTYERLHKPMRCVCPDHGEFFAQPANLLNSSGCVECGKAKFQKHMLARRLTTEDWVARAREKHGDRYCYEETVYVSESEKVSVRCKVHGIFKTGNDHIYQATNCPACSVHESKGERAVASFISIFTPVITRDRTILKPKELDIYLPEHNLAIEYCGEYWHSLKNEEQVREGRLKHYQKYMDCKAKGIRLITIYESEWLDRGHQIRRLLRNAIGKSRGKLMARKCELRNVDSREAKDFYDRYHPQGGSGQGQHYGLYWKGKLVACMRFALGTNDRGNTKERVWTLARYATRITVSGAASRLFKAFLKDVQPPLVKSFSDNRYFDGAMYEALGFSLEAHVNADYVVWSPKLGLRPKSHYQRRELQKRLTDHGLSEVYDHETDPRTETEMTFLMGAGRLYDCGKKRWVYTDPNNKP